MSSGKTTAILNAVASTIVNVKQQCLATAVSSFVLSIQNANVVTINGLNSTNTASATVQNCKQSSQVEVHSIFGKLSDLLDQTIQASQSLAGTKRQFIATLCAAVTVDVVNTCFSGAVAAVEISLQNVKGKVVFNNVTVNATATAAIASCIQSAAVDVGGGQKMPLRDFIQQNESWMTAVDGEHAAAQAQSQVAGAAQSNPLACPAVTATPIITREVMYVLLGAAGLAVLSALKS